MIVISDTSPISGLIQIGHLQILRLLYGKIIIPHSVSVELSALSKTGVNLSELRNSDWIVVKKTQNKILFQQLLNQLDRGEAEAIAIAIETKADVLLIDETFGRAIAKQHGLHRIGLFGILLEAKKQGIIPAIKPLIDDLIKQANFWASHRLIELTLKSAGEDFENG